MARFEYIDINKSAAFCDVRREGNVIIMIEKSDNTGMSVTNACEIIANEYVKRNGVKDVSDIIFVECYDKNSYGGDDEAARSSLPSYARVRFTVADGKDGFSVFSSPKWSFLSESEYEALFER